MQSKRKGCTFCCISPPPPLHPSIPSRRFVSANFSSHPACAVIRPEMLQYCLCSDQTEGGENNQSIVYWRIVNIQITNTHSTNHAQLINILFRTHKSRRTIKKRTYRFLWFIGRAWIWRHLPNADFVRSYHSKSRYWANPDSEKTPLPSKLPDPILNANFRLKLVLINRTVGFDR